MRRIRIAFAALALLLLAPIGLLVERALDSAAREREARHQTVAERVFDEMERLLGEVSRREEERPFGHYGFYLERFTRSPLSRSPEEPYIVGYFQVDPDGSFQSPLRPRRPEDAQRRGDWRPTPALGPLLSTLEDVATRGVQPITERVTAADLRAPLQAPGTTRKASRVDKLAKLEELQVAEAKREASDSYQQIFRDLNRGAQRKGKTAPSRSSTRSRSAPAPRKLAAEGFATEKRAGRIESIEPVELAEGDLSATVASPDFALSDEPATLRASVRNEAQGEAESRTPRAIGRMNQALEEAESYAPRPTEDQAALRAVVPMNQLLGGADSHAQLAAEDPAAARAIAPMNRQLGEAESPAPHPADDLDDEPAEPDSLAVHTVEIGSIAGRLVDPHFLVLHRTAILNGAVYRQGLVLDVPALAGWVADEVLGGTPLLGEARLELIAATNEPSSALFAGDVVYRHRFADPFDPLAVAMALPALADAGFNYLYPISLLLVVAGIAGLLALYRTVSVSLAFAERRNNFVAAVSHELKTPLTSIRMYGEMLRDGMVASEEKRAEYFATITAESERLTRLINNVLEFSQLEQGNREMSLVVGSIAPVVEEAALLLEPHARGLGFAIEVEIEDDLPAVRFDRDAVLQVVFNLVDNALKYARSSGDRSIALRCLRAESGVMLAVRDRGPGVADRHLSKIFEPFYRGEEELTRTAKGTGIGLALVKGLGERMGAAVRFQNADEGGFEVSLIFRQA